MAFSLCCVASSARGEAWQHYLGHGLLMGLIGNSAINAPLYISVTKWFEARRGTALAQVGGLGGVENILDSPAQAVRGFRLYVPDRLQHAQHGGGVDCVYRQVAD